ncbi:unnamed protein product, partial [Ixodes hexagonus]
GIEEGISQVCKKSRDSRGIFVWNFPLDITYKSSNPYGCKTRQVTHMGRKVRQEIRGVHNHKAFSVFFQFFRYRHRRSMSMFVPESSSLVHKLTSWLSGRRPEFVDPKTVARGEGREVTRMTSNGVVDVIFHVVTKDLKKFGYNVGHISEHQSRAIEVEPPF